MKVTVCFGTIKVVVPCGQGNILIRELVEMAILRYKKSFVQQASSSDQPVQPSRPTISTPSLLHDQAGQGLLLDDDWSSIPSPPTTSTAEPLLVNIESLTLARDGGILDWDDRVADVLDDREMLIAHVSDSNRPGKSSLLPTSATVTSVGTTSATSPRRSRHIDQPSTSLLQSVLSAANPILASSQPFTLLSDDQSQAVAIDLTAPNPTTTQLSPHPITTGIRQQRLSPTLATRISPDKPDDPLPPTNNDLQLIDLGLPISSANIRGPLLHHPPPPRVPSPTLSHRPKPTTSTFSSTGAAPKPPVRQSPPSPPPPSISSSNKVDLVTLGNPSDLDLVNTASPSAFSLPQSSFNTISYSTNDDSRRLDYLTMDPQSSPQHQQSTYLPFPLLNDLVGSGSSVDSSMLSTVPEELEHDARTVTPSSIVSPFSSLDRSTIERRRQHPTLSELSDNDKQALDQDSSGSSSLKTEKSSIINCPQTAVSSQSVPVTCDIKSPPSANAETSGCLPVTGNNQIDRRPRRKAPPIPPAPSGQTLSSSSRLGEQVLAELGPRSNVTLLPTTTSTSATSSTSRSHNDGNHGVEGVPPTLATNKSSSNCPTCQLIRTTSSSSNSSSCSSSTSSLSPLHRAVDSTMIASFTASSQNEAEEEEMSSQQRRRTSRARRMSTLDDDDHMLASLGVAELGKTRPRPPKRSPKTVLTRPLSRTDNHKHICLKMAQGGDDEAQLAEGTSNNNPRHRHFINSGATYSASGMPDNVALGNQRSITPPIHHHHRSESTATEAEEEEVMHLNQLLSRRRESEARRHLALAEMEVGMERDHRLRQAATAMALAAVQSLTPAVQGQTRAPTNPVTTPTGYDRPPATIGGGGSVVVGSNASHHQPIILSPALSQQRLLVGTDQLIELVKTQYGLGFSLTTKVFEPSLELSSSLSDANKAQTLKKQLTFSPITCVCVKNILPDGAAISDGRLRIGDQLLKVDEEDVLSKSQAQIVSMLRVKPGGSRVSLLVRRHTHPYQLAQPPLAPSSDKPTSCRTCSSSSTTTNPAVNPISSTSSTVKRTRRQAPPSGNHRDDSQTTCSDPSCPYHPQLYQRPQSHRMLTGVDQRTGSSPFYYTISPRIGNSLRLTGGDKPLTPSIVATLSGDEASSDRVSLRCASPPVLTTSFKGGGPTRCFDASNHRQLSDDGTELVVNDILYQTFPDILLLRIKIPLTGPIPPTSSPQPSSQSGVDGGSTKSSSSSHHDSGAGPRQMRLGVSVRESSRSRVSQLSSGDGLLEACLVDSEDNVDHGLVDRASTMRRLLASHTTSSVFADSVYGGVVVKGVIDGGAAHLDGRLCIGDELLEVNGVRLVNTPSPLTLLRSLLRQLTSPDLTRDTDGSSCSAVVVNLLLARQHRPRRSASGHTLASMSDLWQETSTTSTAVATSLNASVGESARGSRSLAANDELRGTGIVQIAAEVHSPAITTVASRPNDRQVWGK